MKQKYLQVVCLVMIDRQGFVFAARRPAGKKLELHWEFPGGKIESGEAPETALRREIREELRLEIGPLEPLPDTCHSYDFARIQLIPYLYRCHQRPAVTLSEHLEHCWIAPLSLLDFTWAPADLPIVNHLLAGGLSHE